MLKIEGKEEIRLIWKEMEKNRTDLGLELTKNYYRNRPDITALKNTLNILTTYTQTL